MTSTVDVLKNEVIARLKLVVILLAFLNIFLSAAIAYATIVYGGAGGIIFFIVLFCIDAATAILVHQKLSYLEALKYG